MSGHAYKVGQSVSVGARHLTQGYAGTYKIMALMPEERGDHQYRVQSTSNRQQRVIRESEIDGAMTPANWFNKPAN